uniref:Ubiquitin carboxyl-terminal hydrolase MINDY n=1 Tax=Naja naja TaxID=35670 RepID=A0A8C6XGA6_NAJNA
MAELEEMIPLVWGKKTSHGLAETIFCRWTQGFVFSDSESTALEQFEGGPCAVIAPVQCPGAMNQILLHSDKQSQWRSQIHLMVLITAAVIHFNNGVKKRHKMKQNSFNNCLT